MEARYGITSLPPTVARAARLLEVARTEWDQALLRYVGLLGDGKLAQAIYGT